MTTAIACYPRSGSHWLRWMVEQATGVLTGSVYGEKDRARTGIMVHTHKLTAPLYARAVYMLRNPFDAIESYYHYRCDVLNYVIPWEQHVEREPYEWRAHIDHWMDTANIGDLHLVSYEDLHADTIGTLDDVIHYLGVQVCRRPLDEVVADATIEKMRRARGGSWTTHSGKEAHIFRRGKIGMGRAAFTDSQQAYVVDVCGDMMAILGYERGGNAQCT